MLRNLVFAFLLLMATSVIAAEPTLDSLKQTYEAEVQKIRDDHDTNLRKLLDAYGASLDKAVESLKEKGDPDRLMRSLASQEELDLSLNAKAEKERAEFILADVEVQVAKLAKSFRGEGWQAGQEMTVDLGGGFGMQLVWVPPGSFLMGSPPSEKGRNSNETRHRVTITKGFWMGKHEVTQEQYRQVTGKMPSYFKGDKNPVEDLSWHAAKAFCDALAKDTGRTVRLPTEAEWEYACRAGTTTAFFTGDGESDLSEAGWYERNSKRRTHPVGQKATNGWGLHDMHGNVFEWCEDWFGAYPSRSVTDPCGPAVGEKRVIRGGSWKHVAHCRSAHRYPFVPSGEYKTIGFRPVLTPER